MACLRRAAFEPIQIQGSLGGAPQPSGNFSYLKRPILRTEIAIYQLGYFRSGARLVDPVHRSSHGLVEALNNLLNRALWKLMDFSGCNSQPGTGSLPPGSNWFR
jgi:hypothetical protein